MATQLKVVSVERVSVGGDGEQGEGASIRGVFSADGAKLLMQSGAGFVPDDRNSYGDIYLKEMASGAIERLTLDPGIADPESGGYEPAISADGTRVAYTSTFAVTIGGITGPQETVVFKDLITGVDKLISASAAGEPGNDASFYAHFSPDGTQIAFTSYATNLVPGLPMVGDAVFLKDIASGDIRMLSSNAAGEAANNYSVGVGFTPDGSNFAFSSLADNLIEGDGNGVRDIFTKDLTTGAVRRLSVGADGTEGNGDSSEGSFSPDGSKLLFASRATNFVAGDRNGWQDLFIKDLVTGEITLASIDSLGNQWEADSYGGVFSPDGTKIAFYSDTAGLALRDDNGAQDIFVKDLVSGALTVLSANVAGEIGDAQSFWPQFVPDGSGVLFTSYATNLVPDDTNGERDLFIARFEEQQLGGPVQWSKAEGGNGHWYEFVEGPLTWAEARADAEGRNHLGLPGYLATITSEEENAFVLSMTPPNVWVGGSDAAREGIWSWTGGPEVGQVFWSSSGGATGYVDWGGDEPNDAGGEDYLLAHALYPSGTWADAGVPPNPNSRFGYVVEYSAPGHSFAEITPGRTEAETLGIEGGFAPSHNVWASGGAYLQATGSGEAIATGRFSGPKGTYSLTIGYFDETDGASRMRVLVNGVQVDDWLWNGTCGDTIVTGAGAAERVIEDLDLSPGDRIELVGTPSGGEPLRTDYLILTDRLLDVVGSEGADRLKGSDADERLLGFGGSDRIEALGGEDLIFAGAGADTVRAGEGDDTIFGGPGLDVIYTGPGADVVVLSDLKHFDKLYDFEVGVDRLRVEIDGVETDDLYVRNWRLMARSCGEDVLLAYIPDAYTARASVADLLQPEVPADGTTLHRLEFGTDQKGELSFLEDVDRFRFEAEAGKFYVFTMTGDPASDRPIAAPRLDLHSAEGAFLGSSNDSGAPVAQLPFLATGNEPLFVDAYDLYGGEIGGYILSVGLAEDLDRIAGDASTDAVLGVTAAVESDLGYPGDIDWFRAEMAPGSLYRAELSSAPGTNPYLSFVDASGAVLARGYGGTLATVYFRAPAETPVFVQVDADSGHEAGTGVGPYQLMLARADAIDAIPEDASTSTTLGVGETLRSDIAYAGDEDWVRVSLEAGRSYQFDLTGVADRDDPLSYPELALYDSTGRLLAADEGDAGSAAHLSYMAEADALVFAAARSVYAYFTGDYALGVS